jgi:hypothetical protein
MTEFHVGTLVLSTVFRGNNELSVRRVDSVSVCPDTGRLLYTIYPLDPRESRLPYGYPSQYQPVSQPARRLIPVPASYISDLRQSAKAALKKAQAWVDVVEGCTTPYLVHHVISTKERKDE